MSDKVWIVVVGFYNESGYKVNSVWDNEVAAEHAVRTLNSDIKHTYDYADSIGPLDMNSNIDDE